MRTEVEEGMGRLNALAMAMQAVGERGGDLPGDAAEIMGWLGMIWREEHDSLILALADPKQDD